MHRRPCLTAFTVLILVLAGCSHQPDADKPELVTRAHVDLPRYMGTWYVIANIPNTAEDGKLATRDVYAQRADGTIANDFVFRRHRGDPDEAWHAVARVAPGSQGARWSVTFWHLFSADVLVLEVAPDYSWALLGHPHRRYGYVFSRTPAMDGKLYQGLLAKMAGYGYTTSRFHRVEQPER